MNRKLSNDAQLCSVRRVTVNGGKGDGEKLIYLTNGKLHVVLSESHALDILELWHEGTNMCFLSKNGLSRQEDVFANVFPGGMLYTCGLDSLGTREGKAVHGRFHHIPAEIVTVEADETGVRVVADIRETSLIGENLVVRRTVETAYNENALHLTDVITNRAFREEPYCIMYHVNAGYPLCDEGATVDADIAEVIPRTELGKENLATHRLMEAPVDEMDELVYFLRLGKPEISLSNKKLGKKFTLSYNDDNLTHLIQWKDLDSQCYVMAFEPATSWLDDRFRMQTIPPQGSVTNKLTLKFENI